MCVPERAIKSEKREKEEEEKVVKEVREEGREGEREIHHTLAISRAIGKFSFIDISIGGSIDALAALDVVLEFAYKPRIYIYI